MWFHWIVCVAILVLVLLIELGILNGLGKSLELV